MNAGVVLWARRELRRRWGHLALLAVLVAIGGGASIAAVAGARRTETAFPRMLRATHQANVSVTGFTENGFVDLDPQLMDQVMTVDGVTGVTELGLLAVTPQEFSNFFAFALIDRRGDGQSAIWLDGEPVDDFRTLPVDSVWLNESMQNELHKGVGDTVMLHSLTLDQFVATLSGEHGSMTPAGPTLTVQIAGVNRTPEDVSDAPDPFVTYSPAFYDKYHDAIASCRCQLLVNADPAKLDTVLAKLATIYPTAIVEPAENLGGRLTDTVNLQRRAWWLICLTAALAGAVALGQAAARAGRIMLSGDKARRALGMTTTDRRVCRLLVVAPAVIVGAIASVGVAYALSPLAPVGVTKLAEPTPGLHWDAAILVPGALIVLIISLAVGGLTASLARTRVRRTRSAGQLGGPEVALGNRLALGPGRGAIIGVTLATAGLVGAFTLDHSLNKVVETPALYGADFDVSNFLDSADDKRSLGDQLVPDPDVEAVGLVWGGIQQPIHLTGPAGERDVEPKAIESVKGTMTIRQTEGRNPQRPDEIALGRALLEELGAKIGDRLGASAGDRTVELTIVGDDLDPGVDIAGSGSLMTVEGLSALIDTNVQGTIARWVPGADRQAMLQRYSSLGLTPTTPPSEVGHIAQLGGLPGRVGQLLTLLGLTALVNGIVLTVRSGRREVALHRALGFTGWQVVRVHLWQSLVTAVAGVAVGGGLGFLVGRAIDRQLVNDVGAIAETVLPVEVWIAAVVAAGLCIAAGGVTGALALHRRPGAELRTE